MSTDERLDPIDGAAAVSPETISTDAHVALRKERDELQDRVLRQAAEFDNYRKRTERERREFAEAAGVDVIRELIPVVDDLERALAVPADGAAASYRHGVELIHRQLLDVLRRRHVEPLDVVGADFDPAWHESIANEPAGDRFRDGEITQEVRRGYRIGQRLLRPAMVKVAKA